MCAYIGTPKVLKSPNHYRLYMIKQKHPTDTNSDKILINTKYPNKVITC